MSKRLQQGAVPSRLREEFHDQPVAVQNNVLYNKPRAALMTIPQLTDNPLFETSHGDVRRGSSRTLLEDSRIKPSRRTGSLSLSSRDYEGIWRAVQEDATKTSHESKSALEDFQEFRLKLALLKQDMTTPTAPRSAASVLIASGSTRSLNISPSRPTSPLKRLSVIASRKSVTASGLNPQFAQQRALPTVQKIAVGMRAEGLFNLPSPATISPVTEPGTPPSRVSITPTKQRRFTGRSEKAKKGTEVHVSSNPTQGSVLPTAPKTPTAASSTTTRAPKIPAQQVPTKKSSRSSSKDWKVRCIPLPRPVCYSANILE